MSGGVNGDPVDIQLDSIHNVDGGCGMAKL